MRDDGKIWLGSKEGKWVDKEEWDAYNAEVEAWAARESIPNIEQEENTPVKKTTVQKRKPEKITKIPKLTIDMFTRDVQPLDPTKMMKETPPFELLQHKTPFYTTERVGVSTHTMPEGDDGHPLMRLRDQAGREVWKGTQEEYEEKYGKWLEEGDTDYGDRKKNRLYLKEMKRMGGMAPTKYNMGGVQQLPGGNMQTIPGTDAVQFNGASHDDGGIMLDPQTEVEGGETMDKVTMKGGGPKDYFFSQHLKHGGTPFSEHHKNILANGGTQEDIDYLAKMQEKKAGRTTDKIQTASLGGIMKYDEGGPKYPVASYDVYGDTEGQYGGVPDYQPGHVVNGVQMYAGEDDTEFRKLLSTEGFADDWMQNVDPAVLEKAGITSFEDMNTKENVMKYQKAWNELNPDNLIDEDGLFGEQTFRTARTAAPVDDGGGDEDPETPPVIEDDGDGETIKTTTVQKKKDWAGAALGIGAMIPAAMAFSEKPDYMEEADLQSPGIVKAERVAKQHLDRVDFNDQIARNANDATAMNKFIETSGGGPANIANKMAAYAQKQQGDREIKAQEAKANIAIANEEAVLDNKRKAYNAEAALNASKFNVTSQEAAQSANIKNKMYVDEFNKAADAATKDRKLNALQYGINTLASLHRDRLTSQASDNLAAAVDGQRGALQRFFNRQNTTTTETTTTDGTNNTEEITTPAKRGGWRKMKLKRRRRYGK